MSGACQGLESGFPLLSVYNEPFGFRVPNEAALIDFADDLATVVVGILKLYGSETTHDVKSWYRTLQVDTAEEKAKTVHIATPRKTIL